MRTSFLVFLLLASVVGLISFFKGYHTKGSTDQHELDIRLTYKRYKELYPNSQISYEEYKELQKKKAFRKSISSRKLKRMVR